jgi:hypothetical protein
MAVDADLVEVHTRVQAGRQFTLLGVWVYPQSRECGQLVQHELSVHASQLQPFAPLHGQAIHEFGTWIPLTFQFDSAIGKLYTERFVGRVDGYDDIAVTCEILGERGALLSHVFVCGREEHDRIFSAGLIDRRVGRGVRDGKVDRCE